MHPESLEDELHDSTHSDPVHRRGGRNSRGVGRDAAVPGLTVHDCRGRGAIVREPHRPSLAPGNHHVGRDRPSRRVRPTAAGPRRRGGGRRSQPPLLRASFLLPRRRHLDAKQRLRHQDRSLAAHVRMEWKVSGGGQRRMGRRHLVQRARRGGGRRLCQREYRHRPCGQHRRVRARPSGKADRLRPSRRSRDDGAGEGDRRRLLRKRADALALEWMLAGRTAGHHGGDAVSVRLRRHRRRRLVGGPDAATRRANGRPSDRASQRRQLHPSRKVSAHPQGGAAGVRCRRRPRGRGRRESETLPVRSEGAPVQRRRFPVLSHTGSG